MISASLVGGGLLDKDQLSAWTKQQAKHVRAAVGAGMRTAGPVLRDAARQDLQAAFRIQRASFGKAIGWRVYDKKSDQLPALLVGSKVNWLGIFETGGTIQGKMLIPLTDQRIGRKKFMQIVTALMRSGNAFFKEVGGKVLLFAEQQPENSKDLSKFRTTFRNATGKGKGSRIKAGTEIPIAILVNSVTLRKRLHLQETVRKKLPLLAAAIERELGKS